MVTVILTVWRRNNLEEQIQAILGQTHRPDQILVYQCANDLAAQFSVIKKYSDISFQFNTMNLGYFGRFSLALSSTSEYTYILDDDVIPSSGWIKSSIDLCSSENVIVCSAGRILSFGDYQPEKIKHPNYTLEHFIGDGNNECSANKCTVNTEVDFGCNSWFFKTEWLHDFWSFKPYTTFTGEDIHLSASCFINSGIRTLCPVQDELSICGNLKKRYGFDGLASWRQNGFFSLREEVLKYWIDVKGWQPKAWRAR